MYANPHTYMKRYVEGGPDRQMVAAAIINSQLGSHVRLSYGRDHISQIEFLKLPEKIYQHAWPSTCRPLLQPRLQPRCRLQCPRPLQFPIHRSRPLLSIRTCPTLRRSFSCRQFTIGMFITSIIWR